VTTSNILEAEVKTKMIERARRVALLADHSKFGKALSLTAAPLRDIDVVITGRELADADAEALEAAGAQVIRV
jgi:DeoR/GlpR family transcriptional regulator of sugar metabolism